VVFDAGKGVKIEKWRAFFLNTKRLGDQSLVPDLLLYTGIIADNPF
jgi:hypothetical protein